eukprot:CAMPEP_0179874604 /NCGR_PEP_ID=MMETSP0982-20121206/22969_1 /TAXON_ID=483367 /ORGANISM="non described non described, Strain CCMP 2436" /LENGTH=193 /DNA_ID=CAMNT_0021766395 /DNA_START=230 /DNA_END=812 /DNA_ORIENTATION=+
MKLVAQRLVHAIRAVRKCMLFSDGRVSELRTHSAEARERGPPADGHILARRARARAAHAAGTGAACQVAPRRARAHRARHRVPHLARRVRVASSQTDGDNKEAAFHPFDLLDDGLGLAILRCLAEPESLCCAAQVCTRFAKLCEEPYAWKLLLDTALSSSGEGLLVLPSEGMGWRERARLEQRHLSAARVAVI